jgi:exosortase/archaeosortase family protein
MVMQPKLGRKKRNLKIKVAEDTQPVTFTRGLIGLAFLAVGFNFLLWLLPPAEMLAQLKAVSNAMPGWLLEFGGLQVTLEHIELYLASTKWPVTPECAVFSAGLVFVVFVLVFPSTATAKKNALLFGVPLLLVANLIRWWSLLWSGDLVLWKTNFFYDYIGLVTFVLLVALVWFVGIERSIKHEA